MQYIRAGRVFAEQAILWPSTECHRDSWFSEILVQPLPVRFFLFSTASRNTQYSLAFETVAKPAIAWTTDFAIHVFFLNYPALVFLRLSSSFFLRYRF